MPYIIKNGKTYTGNSVTLTQAQYDALSEVEKNNGTVYYIYDSNAVLDASDVALDNGTVEDLAGSVAVIETSPAVANHAVGDFILWNGQLYSVIDAIQVGQTLTVGSNITATSAGSELTSLKSGLTVKTFALTGGILPLYVTQFKNILYFCALYISPSTAITAGSWVTLGVLPAGSRPAQTIYIGGVFENASGNTFGFRGSIATNGTITVTFEKAIATSVSLFGTSIAIL